MGRAMRWCALVLVSSAGCLAACSSGSAPTTGASDAYDAAAGNIVERAEASRYDQSQRDALADGAVDYAEYESAMNRAFDCMRAAGVTVVVSGTQVTNGTTQIDVAYSPPGDDPAEMDACYDRYASLVDEFWQVATPGQAEFEERRAAAIRPALVACMTRFGEDFAADASVSDLFAAAATYETAHPEATCITESGYATWDG
jgi:hypothetical protein